jgi:uncharacterized protein (TIGR03382 family)
MSRSYLVAAVVAAIILPATHAADAHFMLMKPDNWAAQDIYGMPQKSAPCGQADPTSPATPTNLITTFQSGSTITITIDEKVYHPGHYRVALAQDQASLPADPTVHADAMSGCGSADIMLPHSSPFSGPQSFTVQLPPGMTCSHCTLQVVEFMSQHPPLCFYHHCATVNITASGVPDAGTGGGGGGVGTDAGTGGGGKSGGCNAGAAGAGGGFALLALAIGRLVRRRRAITSA